MSLPQSWSLVEDLDAQTRWTMNRVLAFLDSPNGHGCLYSGTTQRRHGTSQRSCVNIHSKVVSYTDTTQSLSLEFPTSNVGEGAPLPILSLRFPVSLTPAFFTIILGLRMQLYVERAQHPLSHFSAPNHVHSARSFSPHRIPSLVSAAVRSPNNIEPYLHLAVNHAILSNHSQTQLLLITHRACTCQNQHRILK